MKQPKMKTTVVSKKNKGKRWRKGHSSDSNPEAKKHRTAAKNRFFNKVEGPSGLTEAALAQHNVALNDADDDVQMSGSRGNTGAESVTGNTFNTWATNYTDCTNTTFSKVHRYWNSNSAQHKEILAVLAAVTEVIKTQGGNETETEYFGALMTALETMEGDETLSAVAYLLSLAIKRVPPAVLKSKFSEVTKCLVEVLGKHANTDAPSLLRSVIVCLASVLRVQDQGVWSNASTMQVYHALLAFVVHGKPKVRKAAHEAVRVVLKGSQFMIIDGAPPHHPAASATAKYCIQQIELCGGAGEATGTLHTLELLKNILSVLPQHSLKSCCEVILRVMTLSNVVVTSVAMRCLHNMFVMQPTASSLPPELNGQLITAMYEYLPGDNDVQPMTAWLAVMEKAHINLAKSDEKLCISHLPRCVSTCMNCMLSDRQEVRLSTARTLKALLADCLAPSAERLQNMIEMAPKSQPTPIHKIFKSIESGLSYQYHAAWGLVLQVLAAFFDTLGKSCCRIMKNCLRSIADLRDSHNFAFKSELDHTVGMAVKSLGPKEVLSVIPLQITGDNDNYDFPRGWLLPVMEDSIKGAELSFFTEYFLPLAARLRVRAVEFSKEQRMIESRTYNTIQQQIWSLLPKFCNKATDVDIAFPGIAKILGSAMTDRPDLRLDVMSSLRKLINQNMDNEANRAVLARFAKNFLPLLFNIYTGDDENLNDRKEQPVFETIKCYMQIADQGLVGTYFDKCLEKLKDDSKNEKRHRLLDLAIAELPYIDNKRLKQLFQFVSDNVKNKDHTVQKKCYRMLEEICAGKSEVCRQFVKSNLTELQEILLKSLSSSSPTSKGPRLKCLVHIVEKLDDVQMEFLMAVVPEAILCTKEMGERPRLAAYSLLVEMGNAVIKWSPDAEQEALNQYFQLVMAGLAGSVQMVAATELALTRILYEFKGKINSELLGIIVESTCLLLESKAKEIVNSALGLLKVLLAAFPDTSLAQYLQKIVSSLVHMKEDNKHHFRFKAKEIFIKLIRKFGFEIIHGMVPESLHKMLANIRKTQERAKRKRKEAAEDESDDDIDDEFKAMKPKSESINDLLRDTDSEDDESHKTKKGKKAPTAKKSSAWLKEGSRDDIVDFLDPSVAKRVLATKPADMTEGKKGVKHDFKVAPDGRFIITDKEDETEQKKGKKPAADIDDIDELLDALGGPSKKPRKRKLNTDMLDDDEDETPMKYKAGGSGIHRPLAIAKRKDEVKDHGAEYRSKKAKGDMKKKGKPDPYAYVPLDMKFLNKRKRAKAAGQFNNLVKGAKKGASKGQKMKRKR